MGCHHLTRLKHKAMGGVYNRLDEARKMYLEQEAPDTRFGKGLKWKDVEAMATRTSGSNGDAS